MCIRDRAKTFGEEDYKLESYILDFDRDIYGKEVKVELYKKLRDNEKYENERELIEQIKKDVVNTRNYFTSSLSSVSYTHLDVYKRQILNSTVILNLPALRKGGFRISNVTFSVQTSTKSNLHNGEYFSQCNVLLQIHVLNELCTYYM